MIGDVRYALRQLARSPGFAAVAVVSLALGIGANTAIFGLIDHVMLRFLPVRQPEELLVIPAGFSYPRVRASAVNASTSGLNIYEGSAGRSIEGLPDSRIHGSCCAAHRDPVRARAGSARDAARPGGDAQ